ncbi:MAG TPA: PD-(D/E)XK nuclease family protein [Gemmatimonadota bacterium]|nr:PD-(D/E)XK nuclease family protein [Gemmatimonadota bacterium]
MLIVVPSRRVAARIADAALAPSAAGRASRGAWTADVATLADVVDRSLAADQRPRRRLGRVASALLAAEVLRDLEGDALRLFGPGIEVPGAARAVAAAIAELRSAGLRAIDLVPATGVSRRLAALAAVVDAWERRLDSAGLLDEPGSVTRAAELVREGAWPQRAPETLEVRGLYDATRVEGELLLALARRAKRVRVGIPFDPDDSDATAFAYPYIHLWESLEDPGLDVELEFYERPSPGVPEVSFQAETDPAQEARRTAQDARAWIDDGVPAEEISIVVPGRSHRLGALSRELSRRGVAHHARSGTPLAETPAMAASLLPFSLLDEGYPRERLEAWVSSPLTAALDPELLLPAISSGPAAGGTREEWTRTLSSAQGESAKRLVVALAIIDDLGRSETAPADFWPRYGEILARVGILDSLSTRDPAGLAHWEGAILALRGAHESLGTWSGPARGWRTHRRAIMDAVSDARAPIGRSGRGVEILTARDARGLGFRRQRMIGLVQGALLRPSPAAAILGDPERRALNRALGREAFRTAAQDALEGDLLIVERVRATGERIGLSWAVEDENGTPLLPALEVERERERRGAPPPGDPPPVDVPAWRAVRKPELVSELMGLERDRTLFFGRAAAGRRSRAGRWDGAFDRRHADSLALEVREGALRAWSASALDSWSQCAHQYFQRYVLRLRPPDERPIEAQARTVGDLAHLALKRLLDEGRGSHELERVHAAVDAVAGAVQDHARGPSAVWALTRRRVATTIHRYLRHVAEEEERAGREPVALEASFGLDGSAVSGVQIDTRHGTVTLRGKIDRLDRHPTSGELHVIDYKYSLKTTEHEEAVDPELCGVERFQLYAYFLGALAWVEANAAARPSAVSAAIHCIRSAAVVGPLDMPDPEVVRASIGRAIEEAASGAFDPTPRNPKSCRICDFRRSCRIATVHGVVVEGEDEQ